jgi:hypothetical protein
MRTSEASLPVVTLWGSPVDPAYQRIYRELEVLTTLRRFVTRHRHHSCRSETKRWVAETIEVATLFERRHIGLRWFVSHGLAGILAQRTLAKEWGIDPDAFERTLLTGGGVKAVADDVCTSRDRRFTSNVVATIGESHVFAEPTLDEIKRALDDLGAIRTTRPSMPSPGMPAINAASRACADCGASDGGSATRGSAGAEQGWRARRMNDGSSEIRYEWRCAPCWRLVMSKQPA